MAKGGDVSITEVPFRAAFEGPALEAGRINARDFAPSLYGISSLVETSADLFFPPNGGVTLQVQANFRKGSFDYGLIAVAAVGTQLWQNLSLSDLKLMLEGIGLLGKNPRSLLRLILNHGDKPVEKVVSQPDGSVNIHIHGDNNTVIVEGVDPRVGRLFASPLVRESVPEVVAPLAKPGITHYRLGTARNPHLKIAKDDLPKLKPPAQLRTELADGVATTALELLSPNFVDGNKWRVSQGGQSFWVRMLDEGFLAEVDLGKRSFAKGDYLVVELRTQAFASPDGLVVDRDVVKVLDHQHRGRQLGFA